MEKLTVPENKFVFVCYQPGSGGERLSAWISKISKCTELQFYKTVEDRTVITNEYFNKTFLNPVGPFEELLDNAEKILQIKPIPCGINIVPSHWDYELLYPYFQQSKFIRIIHDSISNIREIADKKVLGGKLKSLIEVKGYCLMYIEEQKFLELLLQRKISLSMTIGDIHKVILPFKTKSVDVRKNFENYTVKINRANVLNVWYENFYTQEIIDFIK